MGLLRIAVESSHRRDIDRCLTSNNGDSHASCWAVSSIRGRASRRGSVENACSTLSIDTGESDSGENHHIITAE